MSRNETPQDPRGALNSALETGQTGRLVARTEEGPSFRVYVMFGQVLAAETDGDEALLLARARAADHLDAETHRTLTDRLAAGATLGEVLYDVLDEEVAQELLFERFRENLFRFLASERVVEVTPMETVLTENIQMVPDTGALVDELVAIQGRIGGLLSQPGTVLAPGASPPDMADERRLLAYVGDRARVSELLERSPWEPARTLAVTQGMLDAGMLVGLAPPRRRKEQAPTPPPEPVFEPVAEAGPIPEDDDDTAESPLSPLARRLMGEGVEDLEAFQDYDTQRADGAFLTDRVLLDRVELGTEATPVELVASTETLIEMEDAEGAGKDALKAAVSLNFSGPKLQDQEIQRKLVVINDVLATIAEAIEAADGPGAGQARLQLLVEGTSVSFAPLFKGVELSADGRLPIAQVAKNLRKRPAGEHRRLLNRGLSDLIERALSAADDVLDEAGLETMLERIAGYQQRLGV